MSKHTLYHVVTHFANGSHGEAEGLDKQDVAALVAATLDNIRFTRVTITPERKR